MFLRQSARFRRELDDWLAEGIISPQQHQTLVDRYELDGDLADGTPWFLRSSFILRAVAIVFATAALLLIISENWNELGTPLQTALGVAPLLLTYMLGFYHLRLARQGNPRGMASAELDLFFSSLLLGLNIYLQGQIYHLAAYWPNGLLWCTLGALPLAFYFRSALHAGLVQILLGAWLLTQYTYEQFHVPGYLLLALGLVAAWRYPARLVLWLALANVAMAVFRIELHLERLLDFQAEFPGLPLTGALALAILRFLPATAKRYTYSALRPLLNLAYWTTLFLLYLLTFDDIGKWALQAHVPLLGLALLAITVAHLAWRRHIGRTTWVALSVVLFQYLVLLVGQWLPEAEQRDRVALVLAIAGNALLFGLAIFRLYTGRRFARKGEFMEGVAILVVLLLTRYLDFFENYVVASLLFLLCAAMLWGVSVYWDRTMLGAKASRQVSSRDNLPVE